MIAEQPPTLASIFGTLVRHHVARKDALYPKPSPGIDWIYAANGLFKRGTNPQLTLVAKICPIDADVPGLAQLLPSVRWTAWPRRITGALLQPLLRDAQMAGSDGADGGLVRPIEKQYFIVHRDNDVRLVAPRDQLGTAGSLRYTMPERGALLVDLHSHHAMRAYFSSTDDRDDQGLSVSAVIGNIYVRPEIVVRMNIYGHHAPIPATMVFDHLGPFIDRYAGGSRADLDD